MDLVTSCKGKMLHFRVKDLKDILTELGLSKQGKKQDLVDRILAIISDDRVSGMWAKRNAVKKEEVVKLVDDVHRKLYVPWEADLAPKNQNATSVTVNTTFQEEVENIEEVRCLCGSTLQADSMIKCEDKKCNVLQHFGCAVIPERPMEGIQPTCPTTFYCELCRLAHADPFWVALGHPLYPVKLTIASVPTDGTSPVQSVEKTFQLTKADWDSLAKPEFEVQAWCMLLNDKVSFRMHWPQYADLQVNGIPVPTTNRPGSQLLGANGRDDGPLITAYTYEGRNKITLTGCDARVFCLGVRIARRQTVQQILNLIPGESDGERFEDALARVCRCVGGGAATDNGQNADSDSDLEVVADCIPVNLRCPMSGSRMKTAGRFKPCAHMGCFDLEVFVQMNQRSRKWQCPICLKNYSLEDVIIDPYFTRITTQMRDCGEDEAEIEVKPDGSWRVKPENDQISLGQLGQWHLPDGTLFVPMEIASKPKPEALKQEGGSEGHNTSLKLGLKKNKNGIWEVSKHQDSNTFPIVNQDGEGHFGHSATNVSDFGSLSPLVDADVIVLSDSDDEAENRTSSGPTYNKNGKFPVLPQTGDIVDDFGEQFWSLPSTSQVGSSSMNGFLMTDEIGFNAAPMGPDSSLYESDLDMNDGLVDNPLAFGHNDPSLQLFLPTQQPVESSGLNVDDWMSLGLGGSSGGDSGVSCEPAPMNELNLSQQTPRKDGEMDTLADTGAAGSLLLGMNDSKSGKTRSRVTSDSLFSFPRQKRSARPRLYLS